MKQVIHIGDIEMGWLRCGECDSQIRIRDAPSPVESLPDV